LAFEKMYFPEPVFLNRFAAARFVFILGILISFLRYGYIQLLRLRSSRVSKIFPAYTNKLNIDGASKMPQTAHAIIRVT
jgi:hypothetical protein